MKNLKRGMLSVLFANMISLGIGLLSGFILPKNLSVETYAIIKTFQLYASYVGLLHFGFVDGVYLSYGGKDLKEIGSDTLEKDLGTLRMFQLSVTVIVTLAGLISKNLVLTAFGISILPANMVAFYKFVFQAIGRFETYSRIMYISSISSFVLNMFLLFGLKTDYAAFYIAVFIIVDLLMSCALEYLFRRSAGIRLRMFTFTRTRLFENIRAGILLTIGNLSSIMLTSMDRWFIKFLMNSVAFAQYSFAVSMENFLNVAITPLTVTLYNYFCKVTDSMRIYKMRNAIAVFAAFLISVAFPVKYILEVYLTKYIESSSTMFILFGAQLFYIVIKSVYVNLYKARKQQKRYFAGLVGVLVFGFMMNCIWYSILHTKEAFAIGTLISSVFWLLLCAGDCRDLPWKVNEVIWLCTVEIAYQICGWYFSAISGFLIYILFVSIFTVVMMRDSLRYLFTVFIGNTKKAG